MKYDPAMIVTDGTVQDVQAFLIQHGVPAVRVYAMTTVQLANEYHAIGGQDSPTAAQRAASAAIYAVLSVFRRAPAPVPSVGLVHYCTPKVLRAVRRGDAVMMVGPAGCGKTTIGEHVAEALDLQFYITSTVTDTHELMGFVDGYGKYQRTAFRDAFENGGLWIADEIDAWDAAALLTANSALANGYATFPGMATPIPRHADFRMVATANTFGVGADRVYVGRNELDAASLDRFAVIEVDYDVELERLFAGDQDGWLDYVWSVRRKVHDKKIRHVVSSRAITRGALALRDGEEWDDVCDMYLFKGMATSDRSKIGD